MSKKRYKKKFKNNMLQSKSSMFFDILFYSIVSDKKLYIISINVFLVLYIFNFVIGLNLSFYLILLFVAFFTITTAFLFFTNNNNQTKNFLRIKK